jgi:hypothetical protein
MACRDLFTSASQEDPPEPKMRIILAGMTPHPIGALSQSAPIGYACKV